MSEDRFAEVTAIVKRRYETGEYGSAHFRMTSTFWDAVRAVLPKPQRRMPWESSPLDPLLSIPVMVDDDMGDDEWRLVDIYTEEIVFRGGSVSGEH